MRQSVDGHPILKRSIRDEDPAEQAFAAGFKWRCLGGKKEAYGAKQNLEKHRTRSLSRGSESEMKQGNPKSVSPIPSARHSLAAAAESTTHEGIHNREFLQRALVACLNTLNFQLP